ncbi:glycoside hydrolase family 13 protein [Marinicrinis sediminis]|uniref:Glycoside hydrolase family 13 protein n=1 Tax=Marinicrinis sediminis TaxID=1652465 RepID=A0ABW5R780_9BACL
MLLSTILHVSEPPFAFPLNEHQLKLRLRAQKNQIKTCTVLYTDRYTSPGKEEALELEKIATTSHFDYFEGIVRAPSKRVRYSFVLTTFEEEHIWYGEMGASYCIDEAGTFQYAYITEGNLHHVPAWLEDAVVYQIFPDRFYNGNTGNDPQPLCKWEQEIPERDSMYGGDLQGITKKMDYLKELGINTIYMTPIFESPTNHKYDTTDYFKIDEQFGEMEDLKQMIEKAHEAGIRVMLDAVFNHTGDGMRYFQEAKKDPVHSPYRDWYFFAEPTGTHSEESGVSYETFAQNVPNMPKVNTSHPAVQEFFVKVGRYWIEEAGIDAWRLDVANEVDPELWKLFRREINQLDDQVAIIGEVMHAAGPWLRGDQFDGVMNYLYREIMLEFFAKQQIGASAFVRRLNHIRMMYTDQAYAGMLQLLDSHDTERFLTSCKKYGKGWESEQTAKGRMRSAVFFQLTSPGVPMIYYGDEVGMEGETDPDCRRPMIWKEERQDAEMLALYKQLLSARQQFVSLRRGAYRDWFTDEANQVIAFRRFCEGEQAAVIINSSANEVKLYPSNPFHGMGAEEQVVDAFSRQSGKASEVLKSVVLPPYSGRIYVYNSNKH